MAVDAAFADLDIGVSRLREGLELNPEERDMNWACQRCVYSRFVHKNIWEICPGNERVEEIMNLLRETRAAVITKCFDKKLTNEEREKLIIYARNIGLRIINLEENYLHNEPTDFAPDDKLEEEEKNVRAEVKAGLERAG